MCLVEIPWLFFHFPTSRWPLGEEFDRPTPYWISGGSQPVARRNPPIAHATVGAQRRGGVTLGRPKVLGTFSLSHGWGGGRGWGRAVVGLAVRGIQARPAGGVPSSKSVPSGLGGGEVAADSPAQAAAAPTCGDCCGD